MGPGRDWAAGNQCSVTAAWQNSSWHTKILLMAGHFTVLPHTHRGSHTHTYNKSDADLLNVESVGARSCVKIVNTTKHCTFYALSMGTCSSKLLTWKMLVNIFLSFDFTFTSTHTHTHTDTHTEIRCWLLWIYDNFGNDKMQFVIMLFDVDNCQNNIAKNSCK